MNIVLGSKKYSHILNYWTKNNMCKSLNYLSNKNPASQKWTELN